MTSFCEDELFPQLPCQFGGYHQFLKMLQFAVDIYGDERGAVAADLQTEAMVTCYVGKPQTTRTE